MHPEALNLGEVMVFLVAAGVVVPVVRRLGLGSVFGFLLVGLVIGPFGLARFVPDAPWLAYAVITNLDRVHALAELGVIFLLFMIGLELSVDRLWAMRRSVFGLGGAQVIVTGAIIAGIASWFDNPLPAAMVVGAGFALSSTAIVMQLLAANGRLGTATGQTCFAVLLFQDLAVLPILFIIDAFARHSDGSIGFALAAALGQAALAIALILVVGRMVIRPVFRFVGSGASREMFLATVLLVIIGTAIATEHAGLSTALGAFLAGLLFADTEYRHQIEVDIEPFKGLLLGFFFVSVGDGHRHCPGRGKASLAGRLGSRTVPGQKLDLLREDGSISGDGPLSVSSAEPRYVAVSPMFFRGGVATIRDTALHPRSRPRIRRWCDHWRTSRSWPRSG
jgi:monovalent cation:proton antiporter-2 (CPA2) family protein